MSGGEEMRAKLLKAAADLRKRAMGALYLEGNAIMSRSQREFVPVNDAILQGSGEVKEPVVDGDGKITVVLGYGGAAGAYAMAVHEHPSESSPPSWRDVEGNPVPVESIKSVRGDIPWTVGEEGKGPKFLERPFRQAAVDMIERLGEKLRL